MIKPVWLRREDLSSIVEIPIQSKDILSIRHTLHLLGVPEVGKDGGSGFIIGEGAVSISGTHAACEKVVDALLIKLNGPGFKTGLEVAQIQKQGALP